jgi:cysteinyl-tRNA synthetase
MGIRVYNTLTNEKEDFEPIHSNKVGIYLCGPTVYKPSHIGHAVGPIIFDSIKRYLTFRGYDVHWIVNITDVEDKLIVEAEKQGIGVYELAERVTANYHAAMAALGVTGIDAMPKASEHMAEIIDIIHALIAKNAAYESDGDVYFDVTADDDYGRLSNRSTADQTEHRDVAGGRKRNPGDFALWKSAKPEEPDLVKFDSPWGKGRPGWHIECSAMSMKYLGQTFDIHGGGLDLIFPHHENEIAQSETANGCLFAKYWMHHGLTRFNTKKVSKSDASLADALDWMTLTNLLKEYTGEHLRYFILSTHYRRPIDFSPEALETNRKGLDTFYRLFDRIKRVTGHNVYENSPTLTSLNAGGPLAESVAEHHKKFTDSMDDDFNTAAAIASLFQLANRINKYVEDEKLESGGEAEAKKIALAAARNLVELGNLLGLFFEKRESRTAGAGDGLAEPLMNLIIELRQRARKAKDFETADIIRDRLKETGITLEDRPGGTGWSQT